MANSSQTPEPAQFNLPEEDQCSGLSGPCSTTATVANGQLVRIKRKHVERLNASHEKIRSFFGVILEPVAALDSGLLAKYSLIPVANNNSQARNEGSLPSPSTADAHKSQAAQETLEELAKRVQVSAHWGGLVSVSLDRYE